MQRKKTKNNVNNVNNNKRLIIFVSLVCVIVSTLIIFLSIFFTIKFDLNDKIEEFFSETDTVTYSYAYTQKTCELPSKVAKKIIFKYFKDKKFKHNSDLRLYTGSPLCISCGEKDLIIDMYFVRFFGGGCNSYKQVSFFDQYLDLCYELDSVSVVIEYNT